jgi:hypothetical protein
MKKIFKKKKDLKLLNFWWDQIWSNIVKHDHTRKYIRCRKNNSCKQNVSKVSNAKDKH